MSQPFFEFTVVDERTIQDKIFDVLIELDFFIDRFSQIKDEVTEIWEELDQ